jgi:hypothetical protein
VGGATGSGTVWCRLWFVDWDLIVRIIVISTSVVFIVFVRFVRRRRAVIDVIVIDIVVIVVENDMHVSRLRGTMLAA